MKRSLGVVAVVAVVALSGCATKTYVDEQIAEASKATSAKVGEVQKQVEQNQQDISNIKQTQEQQGQQISQLSETAKEALARAEEAGKVAKGKFLFETTLTDDNVHFGFDKAGLSPEAKAALDAFAKQVKDLNKPVYIEVQGHTDDIGSEKYNLKLGQERAENVMRYLNMQDGIPLFRMNAISYGEYKPIAEGHSKEARAKNRRVTLVVLE